MIVTWVLEGGVFASGDAPWHAALAATGDRVISWDDAWWSNGRWPRLAEGPVVVRASLGNAARIAAELPWRPGAFCRTAAFHCTSWFPAAAPWLLHRRFVHTTVRRLVADPTGELQSLGAVERVFVRPDSPLKPFAGRVVAVAGLTPKQLDHGFYYDDLDLPIVAAPVRQIAAEWRYVVVGGAVVAGSAYAADGRRALPDDPKGDAWQFAATIAARLPAPERIYVLDLCAADGALWLLELNPFSGADLYGCDPAAVIAAVDRLVVAGEAS